VSELAPDTGRSWLRGFALFTVLDVLVSGVLSWVTGWSFVSIFLIVAFAVAANAFMMTFDEI
jgi:hypothetical protein